MVPPISQTLDPDALGSPFPDAGNAKTLTDVAATITDLAQTENRDDLNRRVLKISDVFAVTAVIGIGVWTFGVADDWGLLFALAWVIPLCSLIGLYDRDADLIRKSGFEEIPRLACAAMLIATTAILADNFFIANRDSIPAGKLTLFIGAVLTAMALCRAVTRAWVRHFAAPERIVAIGTDADYKRLFDALAATPSVSAEIVAHFRTVEGSAERGLPFPIADSVQAQNVLESLGADRVVVGTPSGDLDQFSQLIGTLGVAGTKVTVQPQLFDSSGMAPLVIEQLGALRLMTMRRPRRAVGDRKIKRVVDIVGASIALVIAAPLLAISAVMIKLDSPGPVFYRQKRIGRDGETFEIIKMRTMRTGADSEKVELLDMNETQGLFKIAGDPRITASGRILRKTSLDELPQLFCVLRGDMSLVGPRPLVPEEDRMITGWQRQRSAAAPGMTGPWQLLGPARIPIDEMVQLDYEYVNNWTLGTDLKILLHTVPHVLARRGV
jgi:exopolysaccharide biosynthesis polyprenyl glycosylphosphotransferase